MTSLWIMFLVYLVGGWGFCQACIFSEKFRENVFYNVDTSKLLVTVSLFLLWPLMLVAVLTRMTLAKMVGDE